METVIITVHVIVAIAITILVLLQQGKGADAGAAFGSGASNTVFGSSGSGNFLTRATTVSAVIFFATSLVLAIYAKQYTSGGIIDGLPVVDESLLSTDTVESDVPQVPAPAQPADDVPVVPDRN
jgi:preprotein translocase subunit SecG